MLENIYTIFIKNALLSNPFKTILNLFLYFVILSLFVASYSYIKSLLFYNVYLNQTHTVGYIKNINLKDENFGGDMSVNDKIFRIDKTLDWENLVDKKAEIYSITSSAPTGDIIKFLKVGDKIYINEAYENTDIIGYFHLYIFQIKRNFAYEKEIYNIFSFNFYIRFFYFVF
ncbi:hypothetical protein [Campylobacter ureolyticus]|uniref:hypothetical protein n=1 Tax=Campylobacter ureolyticus TaxID=827 RepID=UPI0026EFEAC7|nr:hypothetical protein [Campylobacter ureolyticus]